MEHRERFTEITGDRNPLHYEEELAKHSRFGGIIVQGGSTSGLLNAVVADDADRAMVRVAPSGGLQRLMPLTWGFVLVFNRCHTPSV